MSKWESYQFANRVRLGNYWIQVILILTFILGLNHLAMRHFLRIDLTENHRYALSPETKAYLQDLQQPVLVVVTIPRNSSREEEQVLYRYVSQLLKEYAYHSRRDGSFQIDVEYVDIYADLARADSLARQYGLDQVNSILVTCGDRRRIIRPDEIVTFANLKPVAFTGESTLTSAIMEVTQDKSPKLYFLQGHQETRPDDTSPQYGLSQITSELQKRNFTMGSLDLTTVEQVPEDASILVIADPKGPLLATELDKIRSFLVERAGRVIVWVRPGARTNLHPLVSEWGIRLPNQVVIETDPDFREAKGANLIRNLSEHPVTQSLIENQTFLMSGWLRPVYPVAPQPADERLSFIPLFASSAASWAESDLESVQNPVFDQNLDIPGPIPVGVAAEHRASSQLGIRVPGGRLVVIGAPDLFSNQHIATLGNLSLFFNTLNWMLDRDRMLVIPPRPVDTYQLTVSREQLDQIGLLFLSVPGVLILLGFAVYWIRQS
jgi:ABC-type uncharacterized transport system involved in gliding motility auxiliary subunit